MVLRMPQLPKQLSMCTLMKQASLGTDHGVDSRVCSQPWLIMAQTRLKSGLAECTLCCQKQCAYIAADIIA